MKASLGTVAEVQVPAEYLFFNGPDTKAVMEYMGNPSSGKELGMVAPDSEKEGWLVVFEFNPVGYVKDDEKDSLDADAILTSIKAGNEEANKERVRRGVPPLTITGWETKPAYNPATHNLEWCIRAASEGKPVLNHNIRILGRGGVMEVTVVGNPTELATALPRVASLLGGYSFTAGQKYFEWQAGDKIAEYGLTALVAGGAAAVAIKSGLITKLIKPIIVGVAAIGAAIAKMWRKLFGGGKANQSA